MRLPVFDLQIIYIYNSINALNFTVFYLPIMWHTARTLNGSEPMSMGTGDIFDNVTTLKKYFNYNL